MENEIINEKDYQKLIYEESLKQTELLEKQTEWIKKQTIIVSVIMLIVALAIVILTVQVGGILEEANTAIAEITLLTQELSTVLEESSITELLNNANALIAESGDALTQALQGVDSALDNINKIDIDTLNQAIADLQRVIEPLAKLFGR